MTDQVDRDSALRENAGHANPCGLFDLERKPRRAYLELVEQRRDLLPNESFPIGMVA